MRALNSLLLVLTLAVYAAVFLLRAQPGRRNLEVMPEMVRGPAAEPFAASAVFADGKTLQSLPPGVVVRGHPPLRFGATPEEALRAGRELRSPFADPAAELARGAHVFRGTCAVCHGTSGLGDGPVAKRGFPTPPSLLGERARAMADGQIFHVVTFGQNNMPAHAAQIERLDRWRAVAYVRELQRAAASAPAPAAPAGAGAPSAAGGATR
jgi:mono/diheme cytochrome c family protein